MFKIGHHTDLDNLTGCTVILMPPETTGSCFIHGSAPGSRELALLSPDMKMKHFNAVLLTGGSAFGLNAAAGVVRYLEENNIGYKTPHAIIPIVPAAVIYDLNIGNTNARPLAQNAYDACMQAQTDFSECGNIGAGCGATIGKWAGLESAMKGGIGTSELKIHGAFIRAVSVVNAVGDIIDEVGNIIAGALDENGAFLARKISRLDLHAVETGFNQNTVLITLLTNINLNKNDCYRISKRANNGLARSVIPANTSFDGDVVFTFAFGSENIPFDTAAGMAEEAVRQSVINAVQSAESCANFYGLNDDK